MPHAENLETRSTFAPGEPYDAYVQRVVVEARRRLVIDEGRAEALLAMLRDPPGPRGSGLGGDEYEAFLAGTAQCVELCLDDPVIRRPGFVNQLLREALEEHFPVESSPSGHDRASAGRPPAAWELDTVCDEGRRGGDRTKTFGQVKEGPGADAPSFFGGVWLLRRGDQRRRVFFTLVADCVPGTGAVEPVDAGHADGARLRAMVLARGPAHYRLQVEPQSPLGRWIARLAGSERIGQHRGQLALGVLCEAVDRLARSPAGPPLTHLLLGPSRADPPREPWHTGRFLHRTGDPPRFVWRGLAIEGTTGGLVEARATVRLQARILGHQDVD